MSIKDITHKLNTSRAITNFTLKNMGNSNTQINTQSLNVSNTTYYIYKYYHIFTPKNIKPKLLTTRNPVRFDQHENTKFKNHKNNKNKVQRQSRGIRILLYATFSSKHNQQLNKNQNDCIPNSNMGTIHRKQILLVRNFKNHPLNLFTSVAEYLVCRKKASYCATCYLSCQ